MPNKCLVKYFNYFFLDVKKFENFKHFEIVEKFEANILTYKGCFTGLD